MPWGLLRPLCQGKKSPNRALRRVPPERVSPPTNALGRVWRPAGPCFGTQRLPGAPNPGPSALGSAEASVPKHRAPRGLALIGAPGGPVPRHPAPAGVSLRASAPDGLRRFRRLQVACLRCLGPAYHRRLQKRAFCQGMPLHVRSFMLLLDLSGCMSAVLAPGAAYFAQSNFGGTMLAYTNLHVRAL